MQALPDLSRGRVHKLIETGAVYLNGEAVANRAMKLRPGMHEGADVTVSIEPPKTTALIAEDLPLSILHEDEHLIVVDKAAGMVVHPAPGAESGTLVNALLHHCGSGFLNIGGEDRPGIVHRLDKGTSGVMVVAKTDQALTGLQAQFAARTNRRAYQAVCAGLPNPSSGRIDAPVGRHPVDRKRMAVVAKGGREAATNYRLLRAFGTDAALIECRLETGRTHQIRVHMQHIGHGLIGDPVYGPRKSGRFPPFTRQALHAVELGFVHPATGEELLFESQLPEDFQELLTALAG